MVKSTSMPTVLFCLSLVCGWLSVYSANARFVEKECPSRSSIHCNDIECKTSNSEWFSVNTKTSGISITGKGKVIPLTELPCGKKPFYTLDYCEYPISGSEKILKMIRKKGNCYGLDGLSKFVCE